MTPLLSGRDMPRIFIGLELCVVVLVTCHSIHATLTVNRLRSLGCAVDNSTCPDGPLGEAESLVSSGLAVSILSNVVFLARAALLHLRHFPPSVGLLYDLLMAILWILGLAHLVLARDTARALSNGSTVDADGVVATCWALRGVAVAMTAATFYSARLLFDLAVVASALCNDDGDCRAIQTDETRNACAVNAEKRCPMLAGMHAPPESFSPVLAFFPAD